LEPFKLGICIPIFRALALPVSEENEVTDGHGTSNILKQICMRIFLTLPSLCLG